MYVAGSWWRDGKRARSGREAIVALDAKTLQVTRQYTAGGTDPECVAVSPNGQRLYLSNEDAGTASIVDVATAAHRASLVVGTEPEGVTASPDGKWVYVRAETSNVLTVIDAKREKTVANILVDARPRAGHLHVRQQTRLGDRRDRRHRDAHRRAKHRVLRRIKLGAADKPVGLVLSPDEKTLYVATGRGNGVAVIDTKSACVLANVPTGQRVWGIAISPDGRKVYAANSLSNTISGIDTRTRRVVRNIATEDGPWALAVR